MTSDVSTVFFSRYLQEFITPLSQSQYDTKSAPNVKTKILAHI